MILNGKRIPIMILIVNALVLFTLFYTADNISAQDDTKAYIYLIGSDPFGITINGLNHGGIG